MKKLRLNSPLCVALLLLAAFVISPGCGDTPAERQRKEVGAMRAGTAYGLTLAQSRGHETTFVVKRPGKPDTLAQLVSAIHESKGMNQKGKYSLVLRYGAKILTFVGGFVHERATEGGEDGQEIVGTDFVCDAWHTAFIPNFSDGTTFIPYIFGVSGREKEDALKRKEIEEITYRTVVLPDGDTIRVPKGVQVLVPKSNSTPDGALDHIVPVQD